MSKVAESDRFPHVSASPDPPKRALVGAGAGYALLLADLGQRVRDGEWNPGDQIPSERQLCEMYGVSRPLVRQALELGEREGLLVRVPGKGTFIARQRVIQELSRMTTFEVTLEQHELAAERQVIRSARELPPAEVARQLRISPTSPVLYLEVLGLADGRPLALYHSYAPVATAEAAELEQRIAASGGGRLPPGWYEGIADALGVPHLLADQLYEVVAVDPRSASALRVAPGTPAFKVSTIFSTPDRTPVEARVALYPGDRYGFHMAHELAHGKGSADLADPPAGVLTSRRRAL
jgi:GntR family transcriptional regulator